MAILIGMMEGHPGVHLCLKSKVVSRLPSPLSLGNHIASISVKGRHQDKACDALGHSTWAEAADLLLTYLMASGQRFVRQCSSVPLSSRAPPSTQLCPQLACPIPAKLYTGV